MLLAFGCGQWPVAQGSDGVSGVVCLVAVAVKFGDPKEPESTALRVVAFPRGRLIGVIIKCPQGSLGQGLAVGGSRWGDPGNSEGDVAQSNLAAWM